jgi:hypothetical protein
MLASMPASELALSESDLDAVPIFPLPGVVLFPGATLPLHVFEPRYRAMTRDVLAGRRLMAVALLEPGFEADYGERPPVHGVCGMGRVIREVQYPDGRFDIVLEGIERICIVEELPPDQPYRVVRARRLCDQTSDVAVAAAWQRQLAALLGDLERCLPYLATDLRDLTRFTEDAGAYSDRVATAIIAEPDEQQRLLQELDPAERLRALVERLHELLDALSAGKGRPASELN